MALYFISFSIIIISSCSQESINPNILEDDSKEYRLLGYTFKQIGEQHASYIHMRSLLRKINSKDGVGLIKDFIPKTIYEGINTENNFRIITQQVIEEEGDITGFSLQSNYVQISDLNTDLNQVFVHRVHTLGNSSIEELVDVKDGSLIGYSLNGISKSEYEGIVGSLTAKPICFTSFGACYANFNAGLVQSEIDEVLCDWLPCSTIAYSMCVISQGSGYNRTSANYIGDSNCGKVLDGEGNDVK